MNHYEVLGVAPGSDDAAIRRAYLAAARRCHPDYFADADAETQARSAAQMRRVNEAWEVLGNPASRGAYDTSLTRPVDPGVARRAAREPGAPKMPPGKGWTPRAEDDGWMEDFEGWANETDVLPPDAFRSTGRNVVTVAPVALFAVGILALVVGAVAKLDVLVALAFVCIIISAGLFVLLPMFEMSRGRHR